MHTDVELFVNFGIPMLLLVFAYFVGSAIETIHFRQILAREEKAKGFPVTTFAALPDDWRVGSAELVTGSVVISLDYFKRIIASLRSLVGGRVKTYEPLLDRARREALLRLIEDAQARGYDAVVNLRLETSRLANSRGDGKGIAGVEMLAIGTAVTLS